MDLAPVVAPVADEDDPAVARRQAAALDDPQVGQRRAATGDLATDGDELGGVDDRQVGVNHGR